MLNRLTSMTEDAGGGWQQEYQYDRYGNRATSGNIIDRQQTPQNLSDYNANTNRLLQATYDDSGNIKVDKAGRTFSYDLESRQTAFNTSTAKYKYDGDGRRVRKQDPSGATIYVYDAFGKLSAEYSTVGSGDSGKRYITRDHLGSTRAVTDQSQAVTCHDYLPFGEEIPVAWGGRSNVPCYSGSDPIRQRFTGKERDAETGLDCFGARYFSGAQGRFTSVDPVTAINFQQMGDEKARRRFESMLSNAQTWDM